ncbi:MAG: murein biosynthesis integral membrane protein MurJ [Phycisphaerales bacterium]|nr:murein biosynthesis integral membrane protein MurJ [Phycisphaerales bacterium]
MATQDQDNATAPAPVPKSGAARGLVAATWVVSGLTFLSRIAGLVRDAANSRTFGSGPDFGAFTFAFLIPNLFRRLFGEGALSASFLPRYTNLLDEDPGKARAYARLVIGSTALALTAITVIVEVGLALLWLQWRDQPDLSTRVLAVELTMLTFPYMPMVCVTALLGAVLQVHHRFGPTAASPILLNLGIIIPTIGTWWYSTTHPEFDRTRGLYFVCVAILISGVVQIIWSLWALRDARTQAPRPSRAQMDERRADLRDTWRFALPMILGLGVLQLNTFFDGLIASYPFLVGPTLLGLDYPLDGHSAAIVGYAQRLYQFPLGVFGIAVATAIYPALARTARADGEFAEVVRHGLRLTIFIGLPATIGLMFVATPMTAVIYHGGQFPAQDVLRVARVLLAYSPAVCAYSIIHVLTRAYFARGDSMTPVRISLCMVGCNLTLNLLLIWWLGEAGLAASTSICAIMQVLLLVRGARPVADDALMGHLARIASATLVMTVVLAALRTVWPSDSGDWWASLRELAAFTTAGVAAYLLAARLLKLEEWRWLVQRESGVEG